MQLQNRRKLVPERFGMVKRQQPRWGEYARAFLDRTDEEASGEVRLRARGLGACSGSSDQNGDDERVDSHEVSSAE